MRFSELVIPIEKHEKEGADGLIIMPFYRAYDYLFKHLKLLEVQTFQNFDLIVLLSSVSDEKKVMEFISQNRFKYGIIVVKRKEDTGSAGGFFAGEMYALENGYKYIILTDDDWLPEDKNTIKRLVEEHGKGATLVFSNPYFVFEGKQIFTGVGVHFYSLFDISLIKKAGLHFAPMYIGADDCEFTTRIMKLAVPVSTECRVSHPGRHTIFADFERAMLYRVNDMLLVIPVRSLDYIYGFSILIPTYLVFGSERARKAGIHMLRSLLMHKFGKDALPPKLGSEIETGTQKYDLTITPLGLDDGTETKKIFMYKYGEGAGQLIRLARGVFRKKVLLLPVNNYAVIVSMLLAHETWISASRGEYMLARNSNALSNLAKLFLLGFLFPFFLFFGLLTFFINLARKPNTWGFGLEMK